MSTNRYIDKLKAQLAKEIDKRMQFQALFENQVAGNRALLAERDQLRSTLIETRQLFVRDTDELIAERDELRKDAERRVPLYEAIERACGELPDGWSIMLCAEHHAGTVELYGPDGSREEFPTNNERLDYTVIDALEHALQGEQP